MSRPEMAARRDACVARVRPRGITQDLEQANACETVEELEA
jgi:hypothetical protein